MNINPVFRISFCSFDVCVKHCYLIVSIALLALAGIVWKLSSCLRQKKISSVSSAECRNVTQVKTLRLNPLFMSESAKLKDNELPSYASGVSIYPLIKYFDELEEENKKRGLNIPINCDYGSVPLTKYLKEIKDKITNWESSDEKSRHDEAHRIFIWLQQVLIYFKKLNKAEILNHLRYDIGPAIYKCGDRTVSDLETFYYTVICNDPSYVQNLSLKNRILIYFRGVRRQLLHEVVFDVVFNKIDGQQKIHFASTQRYYCRINRKELVLGGGDDEVPSQFETASNSHVCVKGYEEAVRKRYRQLHIGSFLVSKFLDCLNLKEGMAKTKDKSSRTLSEECFDYLKERYTFNHEDLLDSSLTKWNQAAAERILCDFNVLLT